MDVPVLNMSGEKVGTLSIDAKALGGRINAALLKQAYVMYHANLRQGTVKTKNRHVVEGSTRKIYKQKGTGRARHGDRKVPQFRGGGHAHHKQRDPEDYKLDMPKKMRRKANRNALLAKLVDGEVKLIDSIEFAEAKTRRFEEFLKALGVDRRALVAVSPENEAARRAGRNVADATLCAPWELTAFNMLNHRYLVIGKAELEAWLGGPGSQTGKEAKVNPMGRAAAGEEAA